MKHSRKTILGLLVLSSLGAVALASCGGGNDRDGSDSIYICVYDGGYGYAWAEKLAEEYEEETGVEVVVEPDTSILDRIESALKDGGDYDLYFSHDIKWQNYASEGLLANLDDLYETEIEGTGGKTFAERTATGANAASKAEGDDGEEHYYKACWTQGAGGFIYNIDMFEEYGWSVPETYDDLVSLCATIRSEARKSSSGETIVPFAWSGKDRQYYWDYPIQEWWAQLAGMDKVNQVYKYLGPDGSYSKGYEMYNPDTYYKEFMEAYDMWYDLIAAQSENSVANAYSINLNSAKSAFVTGKAAMIPYAHWGKYELEAITDSGSLDFDIAMMATPKAKADSDPMNFMVGYGDSAIIPANATNVEGAKDFLAFLARYDSCKTFAQESHGSFLAFDYADVDMSDIEETDTYTKSIHEKLTKSTNFSCLSDNPITYRTVNAVMPWPNNTYYYDKACGDPSKYTAQYVGEQVYNTAKSNWSVWMRTAGLSD